MKKVIAIIISVACFSQSANAFFFIFPIPNFSKPAELDKLIGALEKSTETKAVAYVSEDKAFGAKMWTWGHYAGRQTQEYADREAMRICENSLTATKNRTEGGQPLYSFGSKKCEMHKFQNVTLNLPDPPPVLAVTVEQSKNIEESLAAKKLKELDSLLASKLITNEEYEKKRKEIIDGL